MFGSFSLGKELIRVYQIYILEYRGEWFKSNSVFSWRDNYSHLFCIDIYNFMVIVYIFVHLEPFCHKFNIGLD